MRRRAREAGRAIALPATPCPRAGGSRGSRAGRRPVQGRAAPLTRGHAGPYQRPPPTRPRYAQHGRALPLATGCCDDRQNPPDAQTHRRRHGRRKLHRRGTAPCTTLHFLAAPTDVNWGGKIDAGRVMRWIDEAAYVCGTDWTDAQVITSYFAGIRFYRPILIGRRRRSHPTNHSHWTAQHPHQHPRHHHGHRRRSTPPRCKRTGRRCFPREHGEARLSHPGSPPPTKTIDSISMPGT